MGVHEFLDFLFVLLEVHRLAVSPPYGGAQIHKELQVRFKLLDPLAWRVLMNFTVESAIASVRAYADSLS